MVDAYTFSGDDGRNGCVYVPIVLGGGAYTLLAVVVGLYVYINSTNIVDGTHWGYDKQY